jgi:Sap, sulfolipid-1-addressing protein
MGAVIGDILGLAAGVAVSPLPIVAMILMLATPRGRANGSLFGVGWLAGLSVLGAVVLLLAGPAASDDGEPAAWTGWLKLLLGVLALLLAARQWRSRPAPGATAQMPKWMAGLDKLKPGGALGLGAPSSRPSTPRTAA